MHASNIAGQRPQTPAYVTLTRRLRGAHASGDAYRKGRHGSLDAQTAHAPADRDVACIVLPFRRR